MMKKILFMLMPMAASASAAASQSSAHAAAQDFLFWFAVGVNVVAIIGIYGIRKLNWIERLFKPTNPPAKDKDKT